MPRADDGMLDGVGRQRHSAQQSSTGQLTGIHPGGTASMLDERGAIRPEIETGERDDHSMQLTEYLLAIIALAAAIVLAVVR
jgi:hypothetical protein